MMREILFRGKRIDNGEWVEGFYWCEWYRDREAHHIYTFKKTIGGRNMIDGNHEVDPETVGQFTGLKDSTGKRIFEGDILEFNDFVEEGYEYKERFDFMNTASVVFINGRFKLENFLYDDGGVMEEMGNNHDEFMGVFYDSKIIGNINNNPESLEVQNV